MALLFTSKYDDPEAWRAAMAAELPDEEFRVWPDDVGDPDGIEFVLAWGPKRGELARLPNLRAIFSLGAGVEHLLRDPDLPPGVPVVRLVDPGLTERMTEYVVHWVLHHHRGFHAYAAMQSRGEWGRLPVPPPPENRRVGILGLGALGGDAAQTLAALGFDVSGWSRSPKDIEGVRCFSGADVFRAFLGELDIAVCLLPLTGETRGIIDRRALAALPAGACLINAGRGPQVVEQDLLEALDTGHLEAATLDVFETEPLAAGHPFWTHPKVIVTPHVASQTSPDTAAPEIAANIRRIRAGKAPFPIADPARGY